MNKLNVVALKKVKVNGGFLGEYARMNREDCLFRQYSSLESTGRLEQLRMAASRIPAGTNDKGHIYWDSDIAKWIEAAGFSLAANPNVKLESLADTIIDLYEQAQEEDGYLNTYFSLYAPERKWTDLRNNHEMYCAGHIIEAAIAYFQGTSKRKLLDVACRVVDHLDSEFGIESGKLRGYPGHEELELALVKLYRTTKNPTALKLAKFLVDERGAKPNYFDLEAERRGEKPLGDHSCLQAHMPVREQHEAVGHAVRALYLYCGMVDVACADEDNLLMQACRDLWSNIVGRKMYITGGAGARPQGESFGEDFELPNSTAYAETCAAIGLFLFAHRLLLVDATSEYADVMEKTLYNGILSGISSDGKRYFYVNPLSYDGKKVFNRGFSARQEWFECACCPTNIARLLASLGQYMYSTSGEKIYVHLFSPSEVSVGIGENQISLAQETSYPWDGEVTVKIAVAKQVEATICLRVPGWCGKYQLKINRENVDAEKNNGYLEVKRTWKGGEELSLQMDMPVQQIVADLRVEQTRGCVALQRGPLVYCAEQIDNTHPVSSLAIPETTSFKTAVNNDLGEGCIEIQAQALSMANPRAGLYHPRERLSRSPSLLRAIPYALWGNRGNHPMIVWLKAI